MHVLFISDKESSLFSNRFSTELRAWVSRYYISVISPLQCVNLFSVFSSKETRRCRLKRARQSRSCSCTGGTWTILLTLDAPWKRCGSDWACSCRTWRLSSSAALPGNSADVSVCRTDATAEDASAGSLSVASALEAGRQERVHYHFPFFILFLWHFVKLQLWWKISFLLTKNADKTD